ncbi:uncharacterized protein LOC142358488 [Convolutriloba macropyga]|uniref:uncharacterized protein LOC142358488 n=1 Tax=Convolutriloba macropyga TaxID=536237 RepID=UPI003F523D04
MEIYDEDAIGVAAFEDSIEATRGGRGRNGTTDDTQSLDFVAGWSALRNNNNRAHTIDVSTVAAAVSNDNRIRRQSRDEIFGTQFRHQAISIDFYDYDYDSNYEENGDEDDIINDDDDDDDDLGSCRDSDHYAEDDRPQLRRRLYEYVQQSTKQEIDPSEYILTSHCVMSRDLGNNRTRGTFLMTTGDDHKFIRLMTALLVHQKDLLPLRRLVKWSTILIAFFSVALYIMVEVSLYMTSEESSDDGVMCVLRIFSSVMVTIPNISFRKQLKNLMEREHSRMILLTVNPKKYIKICSCFLVFELTFAGFTSYYWGESYWPEIEAANISYSGRYALMVFHPMNIIVTNLWNFAIAIICMLMCSNLVDELSKYATDLNEDRILCELNFVTSERGRAFAKKKYPLLIEQSRHFKTGDVVKLRKAIMTRENILTRYYDLQMKLNACSLAFQKWFLINITGIFLSVVQFLFSLLGDVGGADDFCSLFLISSPLFWVPLMIHPVMRVNLKATQVLPNIYPLEDRLPVFQRLRNLPLAFHVYNQRLNRTSVAAFITVLLVGLVGRIWSLATL